MVGWRWALAGVVVRTPATMDLIAWLATPSLARTCPYAITHRVRK